METNRLKQFCVVCETGNLRKAAELLNMSHSALSKSLKVLQSELNLKLLEQDGRGILITEVGKDFVKKAQSLLDLEKSILRQENRESENFRFGSFESFSTHLIGTKWAQYFGDMPLQIHEMLGGKLEMAVADGEIDAAVTYEPIPTKDVDFSFMGKVRMGIFHRKGFFKKSNFEDLPFVAPLFPAQRSPSSEKGLDGWPEHEVPRYTKYRVDLMESGLALVRSGQAAIFIPEFVAKAQNLALSEDYKLIEREYPNSIKTIERRVFLVTRGSRKKEKTILNLIRLLKSECVD